MNWSHYKCDLIMPDIVGGDLFQCNLGVFTVNGLCLVSYFKDGLCKILVETLMQKHSC